MKRVVWKYELTGPRAVLRMDAQGQVLCVQMQGGRPQLWALVDPGAALVERSFLIVGTGHAVESDNGGALAYVGTVQQHGGMLVWHVFEQMPGRAEPPEAQQRPEVPALIDADGMQWVWE